MASPNSDKGGRLRTSIDLSSSLLTLPESPCIAATPAFAAWNKQPTTPRIYHV